MYLLYLLNFKTDLQVYFRQYEHELSMLNRYIYF